MQMHMRLQRFTSHARTEQYNRSARLESQQQSSSCRVRVSAMPAKAQV